MSRAAPLKKPSRSQDDDRVVETLAAQITLAQATELARAGRYTEAEEVLQAPLQGQHHLPIVLDLLARMAAQQGQLGQAKAFWERAAHLDPRNRTYQAGLTRIEQMQLLRWHLKPAKARPQSQSMAALAGAPTPEDFLLARPHGGEWRYELVRGRLEKSPIAGGGHDRVVYRLVLLLGAFVEEQRLGAITLSRAGYDLTRPGEPHTVRIPDLAFVQAHRVPAEETPAWTRPWKLAPDLVAEVSVPGQSPHEMAQRARGWLDSGVQLMWVIWPASKTVDVWHAGLDRPLMTLGAHETLEGSHILPGFTCPVAQLFQGVHHEASS